MKFISHFWVFLIIYDSFRQKKGYDDQNYEVTQWRNLKIVLNLLKHFLNLILRALSLSLRAAMIDYFPFYAKVRRNFIKKISATKICIEFSKDREIVIYIFHCRGFCKKKCWKKNWDKKMFKKKFENKNINNKNV